MVKLLIGGLVDWGKGFISSAFPNLKFEIRNRIFPPSAFILPHSGRRLLNPDICPLTSVAWHLSFGFWPQAFDIRRLFSAVWILTSFVRRLSSALRRLISILRPLSSETFPAKAPIKLLILHMVASFSLPSRCCKVLKPDEGLASFCPFVRLKILDKPYVEWYSFPLIRSYHIEFIGKFTASVYLYSRSTSTEFGWMGSGRSKKKPRYKINKCPNVHFLGQHYEGRCK